MDFVRATRAPIRRLIEGHPMLVLAHSLLCVHTRPQAFSCRQRTVRHDGRGVSEREILQEDVGDKVFMDS